MKRTEKMTKRQRKEVNGPGPATAWFTKGQGWAYATHKAPKSTAPTAQEKKTAVLRGRRGGSIEITEVK